jgi:hypothetical protein
MKQFLLAITFNLAAVAQTGVIDRVAVVVGNHVITESEVLLEARLVAFLNGQPLDLSPAQRRAAAERLVDQQLIRNEMQVGGYAMPVESQSDAALRSFRQANYAGIPAFRAALEKYGLTEDEVGRHLLWQAAALRFTDQRFRPAAPPPASQTADRSADPRAADGNKDAGEDEMDVWLKQARSSTRIQFKKGAFQ